MKGKYLSYFYGEFGWQLMAHQAFLRYHSDNIKFTVVVRKGTEFMYKDFAEQIYTYNFDGTPDGVNCKGMSYNKFNDFLIKLNYNGDILNPENIGFYPMPNGTYKVSEAFKKQEFIEFKSDTLDKSYGILIHARKRSLAPERNWHTLKWQLLIDRLLKLGYSVASIGTDAYKFDGITAHHNIPLQDTISLMNRSNLVIGGSSGAMHLASLAGAEHLVWSVESNRERYEKYWNPLKTRCYFYGDEGWNPTVDNIMKQIHLTI